MAECTTENVKQPFILAEGDDLEDQVNELIALGAIYEGEDLDICDHDNTKGDMPGGIFSIPVFPPEPFHVKITKDTARIKRQAMGGLAVPGGDVVKGRGRRRKSSTSSSNEESEHQLPSKQATSTAPDTRLYPIKRLPPITLTFAFPHDYPSQSPPHFTLSACWLDKHSLSRVCEALDSLWLQQQGTPVIMNWVTYLQEEMLDCIDLQSPYDLSRVVYHVFTHPVKAKHTRHHTAPNASSHNTTCHKHSEETSQSKQNNTEHTMHQKTHNISQLKNGTRNSSRDSKETREFPEHDPFDRRAIQTYSALDEVLPKVLDFNLMTCDVCFEEKPGAQFLRLVSCVEHTLCKACSQGWFHEQISQGAVADLTCPGYMCNKPVLPTEIASVVSSEMYERYDRLLLKTTLDTMTDVTHCPRPFCQFPVVLEDNLGLCQKCKHAFCGRCKNTYHGHTPCKLKADMFAKICKEYETCTEARRTELEVRYGKRVIQKAIDETHSDRWLQENSKQCPSCSTFIQKNDGCNKMTCTNCRCYFCWLCDSELSRTNPYAHYQHPTSPCANRLFEGTEIEDADNDDNDDDGWPPGVPFHQAYLVDDDYDDDGYVVFADI